MNQPASRLSAALRALLEKNGRTLLWLLKASSLSPSTVNRILSGQTEPATEHIKAFCTAFPDWPEQRQIVVAHLQDQLEGSGVPLGRVLIRDLDTEEADNLHLLPELDGYLRTISHRLMQEQAMPEADRLVTQQVDWLSGVAAKLSAMEADTRALAAETQAGFDTKARRGKGGR